MNTPPGLHYIPDWISPEEEERLLSEIEKSPWELSLKRRVQQYGPVYDYSTKKLNYEIAKSIPSWLELPPIVPLFKDVIPAQIIVNEYKPKQGITRHIDSPLFGPVVGSLSLLSDTDMLIGQWQDKKSEFPIKLARRSLLVLSGEARSQWYHCVPSVDERRISITFRTVL